MNPELASLFEKLSDQYVRRLPFALYRKPGTKRVIGYFQQDAALYEIGDFSESGFAFVSFDNSRKILIPMQHSEIHQAEIQDLTVGEMPFTTEIPSPANAKNDFEQLVQSGIEAIQNGAFGKVVLSRKESFETENFGLISSFQRLIGTYPTAFVYCFFHPQTGLWLGAFSEQLIGVRHRKLQTMAVAGTQVYQENTVAVWQSKESSEQQFVTDFIKESLRDKVGEIQVSEPYTMKAGNLIHLKTDIEATLNEVSDLKEVISILHPTPAVCGFPREKAKRFIDQNEGYDREFYSGFLGELNADIENSQTHTELYVNLRCMKVEGQNVAVFVGCGITKDSVPEKEWTETVNKAKTIKKIL